MIENTAKTVTIPAQVTQTHTLTVSLDNFADEPIIEYLRSRGYAVDGERKPVTVWTNVIRKEPEDGDMVIEREVLECFGRLIDAGQREAARAELIELVGHHIRRPL